MRELDPNSLGDHLDRLYRAAWALCGSREDAEDLVQDTFAKILTRPRFLRGEDDLWYLMRTLKNVFLSQRRTLARRSPPVPLDEDVDPVEAPASARPDEAAQNREVYTAIADLPDGLPRGAGGDRRGRALLRGGLQGARRAPGHDHEPLVPGARTSGEDPLGPGGPAGSVRGR